MALRRSSASLPDYWRGSSTGTWNPFREISRLQRSLDRMFDDILAPGYSSSSSEEQMAFSPPVDIEESSQQYRVCFDLPGVSKNDIKIEMKDNQLVISGERKKEETNQEGSTLTKERYHGYFQRSFMLPSNVDAGKIEASYQDGVLEISLPKAESAQPKMISIKEGGATPGLTQGKESKESKGGKGEKVA